MTNTPIDESGMRFGPYPEGQCFYIEKSAAYQAIQKGVKIAEFLLLRTRNGQPPKVWIIEAKSGTPRPETQPGFDEFVAEIREKLSNALSLVLALRLSRHGNVSTGLPASFKVLDLAIADFRFVLVINGHHEDWLPPLQDALSKALHSTVRTWGFSPTSVVVINDTLARTHGLILTDANAAP